MNIIHPVTCKSDMKSLRVWRALIKDKNKVLSVSVGGEKEVNGLYIRRDG